MTEDTDAGLPTGVDDVTRGGSPAGPENYSKNGRLKKAFYEEELTRLQEELVKLQYWVVENGLRVLIIFEGRGSAGKGGVIKRIMERTSPRDVKVVALPKPNERERTQWYFQRYVAHLPRGGRDRHVRSQLVQPLERGVGDGFLHRGGAPGVPAQLPGVRAHAGQVRDHPAQVLVLGELG